MGQVKKINHLAASDDRRSSASFQRGGDEVMRIVTLTADSEKKIPGRERARIDGISGGRLLRRITCPQPEDQPQSNERCPAVAASFAFFPGLQ